MSTKWTPELLAQVRVFADAGKTMRQAAAALRVQKTSLQVYASNYGIKFRGNQSSVVMSPPATAYVRACQDLAVEIARARAEAPQTQPYRDPAGWPR